ncbi:MAG TPA: response regulator [Dermatophilaceae bacterium]|nr:response regulator [Dermatophilaceae bacterium]
MRALVIDDSATMRHIVADTLGGLGFATSQAGNGREALALLEAGENFDVACIDWNMPVMDGLEFVVAVRARHEWRDLTLIMVTTEAEVGQIVRALAAGAHEYVIKPFTADSISSKLELLGLLPLQETSRPDMTGDGFSADDFSADDFSADDMSQLADVEADQVTAIASEVFAAMVDGRSGLLTSWPGGPVTVSDPLHAWVDLSTEPASRVQLTADISTADDLTRAFLRMDAAEPVTEADVVDVFGEIVNVFGGNIKALLPEHVGLTLPEASRLSPSGAGAARLNEVRLAWRGHPLVVSLWTI